LKCLELDLTLSYRLRRCIGIGDMASQKQGAMWASVMMTNERIGTG